MAITLVGSVKKVAPGVTSTTLAASPNPTAANVLVLHQVDYDGGGPTISTPTAASHTFVATQAQRSLNATTALRSYYEANCPGGAVTITFASSSGTGDIGCIISEYAGVATTSPLDQITASGGSGGPGSTTATATTGVTTQADEVVIGLGTCDAGGTITPAQTQVQEDESYTFFASYQVVSSTGAKTNSWTVPSSTWACDVFTLKAASTQNPFTPDVLWSRVTVRVPTQQPSILGSWRGLRADDTCPAGPYLPGVATNVAVGDVAWSNPNNVKVSDDTYATAITAAQTTQQLQVTGLNFQIPYGQQIDGILVECEAKSTLGGDTVLCRIIKGAVVSSTSRSNTWENAEAQVAYGGSTDLWGETWTVDDINAGSFGVSVRQEAGLTATLSLDAVRVTVYCSTPVTMLPHKGMDQPMMDMAAMMSF